MTLIGVVICGKREMKTPEEIKKWLEICIADKNCRGCPYNNGKCGMQLEIDALAYIQQLEAQQSPKEG